MKKIFISCALVASAAAFAQQGKVGINENVPQATLDIKPNATNLSGTTNEGILIPRLTAARVAATATPVVGTLVYVTDAPAGANAASFSDTTSGFYYWNGTIWTKIGSGATGSTAQPWEQIRTASIENITTNLATIGASTYFATIDAAVTQVKLPLVAKDTEIGKTVVLFKSGAGNVSVLDGNGVASGSPGALVQGTTTLTSARGKSYIWNGTYWYPAGY